MFSKSCKVGSPADREMSIPRPNVVPEAVTAPAGAEAFAGGSGVGASVGNAAAPATEQIKKCIAMQMRTDCVSAIVFFVEALDSGAVFFTKPGTAEGMPPRILWPIGLIGTKQDTESG